MLAATSFQITLLSGQNWEDDLQLYVLGGVFLLSSAAWYAMFRLKPSIYCLSAPWIFFGLSFFIMGLPSMTPALHPAHKTLANIATWFYAVASSAAFVFFGLNFGEEAVSTRSAMNVYHANNNGVGCRNGSMDEKSNNCARFAASMGGRSMVLGK